MPMDNTSMNKTADSKLGKDHDLKGTASRIGSSFNDLVVFNDQGQPYLDINRLVYKPKKLQHEKEKEKLSWYMPDYFFMIFNFLSLTFASYYFLNGLTIVSWRNSMQSFKLNNCSRATQNSDQICESIIRHYGNDNTGPYTILRFAGFQDPSNYGMLLLLLGVINPLNVVLGIYASLNGQVSLLISHTCLDVLFLILEVLLVSILKFTGRCDVNDMDIIRAFLLRHVRNYAQNSDGDEIKKDTMQLDTIQISLTCCGVSNWTDFLPRSDWTDAGELITRSILNRPALDRTDLIIPSSCCRQWWVRNIYCAHGAHLWAYPSTTSLQSHQFRQRVSQMGCLPKMVRLCNNMIVMAGIGGYVACCLHLVCSIVRFICAIIQIKNITTLIRERKRIFQYKEHDLDVGAEENEEEEDMFPSISTLFDDSVYNGNPGVTGQSTRSQIPNPPTESELADMNARKQYNKLKLSMKTTHVEQWMKKGVAFVESQEYLDSFEGNAGNELKQGVTQQEKQDVIGDGVNDRARKSRRSKTTSDAMETLKLIQNFPKK